MTYEEYKNQYKQSSNTQSTNNVKTYQDYVNKYKTPQNVSNPQKVFESMTKGTQFIVNVPKTPQIDTSNIDLTKITPITTGVGDMLSANDLQRVDADKTAYRMHSQNYINQINQQNEQAKNQGIFEERMKAEADLYSEYEKQYKKAKKENNIELMAKYSALMNNSEFAKEVGKLNYDAGKFGANYKYGSLGTDLNETVTNYLTYPYSEKNIENKEKIRQAEELMRMYAENAENYGKGGLITKDLAGYLPQAVDQTIEGTKGALGGAVAGGAIGTAVTGGPGAGTITGAVRGAQIGYAGNVARYSYDQMLGASYKDLIDLGVPEDIALEVATDTALWQSIVEGAGAGVDVATLGVGKLFSKGIKTTAQLTAKKMIQQALKAYGINLATESAEEAIQEGIAIEGEKKALEQAGIERTTTAKEDWKRIGEAGLGGFKIALVTGGGNVIGNVTVNTINNSTIKSVNKQYDEYIENVKKSNLTEAQKQEKINSAETGRKETLDAIQQQIEQTEGKKIVNLPNLNQSNTNIEQNALNTEQISQNNVQNVSNLENTVQMEPIQKILSLQGNGGYRTQEQIDTLREDIKQNGIQKPIELTKNKDGQIIINDGNHRLAIANELGMQQVPVKYLDEDIESISDIAKYNQTIYNEQQEGADANANNKTGVPINEKIQGSRNNNGYGIRDNRSVERRRTTEENDAVFGGQQGYNNRPSSGTTRNQNITGQEINENSTQGSFLMPSTEQLQAQDQKQGEEAYNTLNMKKPKLEDIAELTEEQAQLPKIKYKQKADKKNSPYRSKFFENVETSKIISQNVKDRIDVKNYERKANLATLEKVTNKLDENPMKIVSEWQNKKKNYTDEDVALGAILMERLQAEGRFEEAVDVVYKLVDMAPDVGRAVQMYSIFQRLTPEGMMIYQQRKLSSALETLTQKQTGKWVEQNKDKFKLTKDDATFITAKVQEAQNAPTERQKQIALAEIEKRINDKLPPEAGQSVKAFRRIAMLFNPKTQVRNIGGNVTVMPLNYVTDLVATGIDKAVAKKTGVRTTALPNVTTIGKGFKKGASETIDDYRRGIRTTPTGSRYEIQNNAKSFNENTNSKLKNAINRKLNGIDRILSTVLELGDRPFYEAAYQNSLQGQMKANGVAKPTQEMIDIASNVALSQTWQDNNNYTQAVLGIRSAFNKINVNGFGLGDLIIPFAKTPANLTKAMVDYSPAGLIPTIINYNDMRKAISRGDMTAMQQKKFVTSVGKAVAGTLLYVLAGALVKGGKITGSADEDKDVANFEKNVLGIQPYSIKFGDKTFTYNWAQPLATPFAIMSDTYKMSEEGAEWYEILLNAFKVAGDQLVANSFLQGIQELLSSEYGNESAMDNLVGAILDLPTQFTPTLFGQVATQFDSTKRQTFENGDTVGTTVNEVKNKIPGVRNTLAPQVNTFGEEIQNYGGDNNPFNVFLNPGNISSTNATDTQKELYALYEVTKDKTIFPRQAPYSVSGGGEKFTLSSQDRADYQKTSGQYVTEQLDALFDSKFYKSLDNSKKVDVVAKIVGDADTTAKDKWIDTESTERLADLKNELNNSGIPLLDYYNAWIATQGIEGDKNWRGETITNSKSKKQKEAIDKATPDLDKWERRKLYEIFNVGKSVW